MVHVKIINDYFFNSIGATKHYTLEKSVDKIDYPTDMNLFFGIMIFFIRYKIT